MSGLVCASRVVRIGLLFVASYVRWFRKAVVDSYLEERDLFATVLFRDEVATD